MDIFGTDIWFSDCRFAGVRCLILWFNAKLSLLFPTRSTPDQSLRIWSHTWNLFAFIFWIASKYFCSLIRTTRIFSQHTCHRACSHRSIHIQSGQHWVFKSVFVNKTRFSIRSSMSSCRSLLDFWSSVKNIPDLQNTAMLLFVSLWPIVQYRSLFTLHWNSSCAWRFTGSLGYLITQNTQHKRIFFAQCFRDKKDAGCSGGPKSSNSSAKTCHGGCVLGGCGGPSTRRPQFAYLHTLILLSLHLPQVHSQRHHALSPDLPHKHCSCHTCHARAPTLIFLTHILATPATPTSTQHFTYILATPATHRITYPHIFWRRLPRRTTDTKFENKTKKTKQQLPQSAEQRFFGGSPLLIAPIAIDMHGSVFWSLELLRFRATSTKKSQTSFATHTVLGKRFCHHIFPKPRH